MRKKGFGILIIAGLLFFCACKEESVVPTPTPSAVPTEIPGKTVTPQPSAIPDLSITPEPTATTSPAVTEKPTVMPEPEISPEPTDDPSQTVTPAAPTPDVTGEPADIPEPTAIPEPTFTPIPTVTPEPTATPMPTATPTPTPVPETLVNAGWQKTVDMTGDYTIIFPDCLNESEIIKGQKDVEIFYRERGLETAFFSIAYTMTETLEDVKKEVLEAGGGVLSEVLEEKMFSYESEDGIMKYRGLVIEQQYSSSLVGDTFGTEDQVTGTMHIIFCYPLADKEIYDTEKYQYYVVPTT